MDDSPSPTLDRQSLQSTCSLRYLVLLTYSCRRKGFTIEWPNRSRGASHSHIRLQGHHMSHMCLSWSHTYMNMFCLDLILSTHFSGSPGVYPPCTSEYCLLVAGISDGFSRRSKAHIHPFLQYFQCTKFSGISKLVTEPQSDEST